jgi:hypothetical protein
MEGVTMPTQYTIYLVNQGSSSETFWCFLERPQELVSDPNVFANSSASLNIDPNAPGINSFTIPVQYVVGAGASNEAVGLNVKVTSTLTMDSDLGQVWDAIYANAPPNKGPKLTLDSAVVPDKSIKIITNAFEQEQNEANGWYSNQSFGIQTAGGFIGMTWSPSPNQNRTLTPKLSFYVSVGSFGSSKLAEWTQVSNESAVVNVPGSFTAGACTVTLLNNGKWKITPGKPMQLALLDNLEFLKSDAHRELMAMAYLADGSVQSDNVTAVHWTSNRLAAIGEQSEFAENTYLTGSITVGVALTAAFTYFVLSGVNFTVNSSAGQTTVDFVYNGTLSAQHIQSLLVAGVNVFLEE